MLGRSFIFCALLLAAGQASALTIYKYVDQHGTVTYSDKAVPGAQVFVFRDRMVEKLDNLVKLETKKHDAGETLVLRNDLYAPVEVELRLERLVNVAGAPDEPMMAINSPRLISTLTLSIAWVPFGYTLLRLRTRIWILSRLAALDLLV